MGINLCLSVKCEMLHCLEACTISTPNVITQKRLIWSVPFDRSDQRMHRHHYIQVNIYCIIYAEYVRVKGLYLPNASSVNKQNSDYPHRNVDTRTDTDYKSFLPGRWVWPRNTILVIKVVKKYIETHKFIHISLGGSEFQ